MGSDGHLVKQSLRTPRQPRTRITPSAPTISTPSDAATLVETLGLAAMSNLKSTPRPPAIVAVDKLKVYAQPLRPMILSCLLDTTRNVGEIAEATGIGQPAPSQQLAELRRAELVTTRKDVKQVWYALTNDDVAVCVRNMAAIFGGIGAPEPIATVENPQFERLRSYLMASLSLRASFDG